MHIGDIRLTLLPDGYHRCDPLRTFVGSARSDWDTHSHLLDERGRVVMTMGALLAELADGTRVLIDLGFGPQTIVLAELAVEFWGGRLLASLDAAGLAPDDIDVVCYSHLHVDHVGWTSTGGVLTFSRARHVMARTEWEHWNAADDPAGPGPHHLGALADRVELTDGDTTIVAGLTMIPTPGHTPGHCSFIVSSGTERAVVLGDAIHCPLQITHPEWEFSADVNKNAAKKAREHLLRELDAPRTTVVGPHFPDAVFGRVLAGSVPRQVAFDIVPSAPAQSLAPEAPAGELVLPALS